jgi:hypothetical protein
VSSKSDQPGLNQLYAALGIRRGLAEKLLYFYGATFQTIFNTLDSLADIDFLLRMDMTERTRRDHEGEEPVVIRQWEEPAAHVQVRSQEVIDDLWAAYLCWLHGFTKQAQGILRNTIELVVQSVGSIASNSRVRPPASRTG